jgi:excisionase family DNA binding protein
MSEKFLTTEQVAGILQINIQTVRRLTHEGVIKGFKLGHKIRYKPEDISNSLKEISHPFKLQPHAE